jgi:hypothetical protein
MGSPVVRSVGRATVVEGIPEVVGLRYECGRLGITLRFEGVDSSVCVDFDRIRGFRLLDEGDLLEFWSPDTRADGWMWRVERGGWVDLESRRAGFISGVTGGFAEFLVLGQNDCVSVISQDEPEIRVL